MKNYRKTVRTLKKARFLSMWAAVFVFAASLVLIGCPNQASSPAGGGESTQGTTITINYKSEELKIQKWDTSNKKWTDVPSGTAIDEGTRLWFEAKVPSGKMVDKWVLNGKKEITSFGNDGWYTIKAEDTVEEAGKKVIKVERILKDAASITINYNPDELTVEKKDTANGKWTEIPSGSAVDEGSGLWFNAKNIPSGKILDKWVLNNGKKEVKPNYIYSVRVEDAVEEAGKKVIKVECILKDAASITINYNPDELTVKDTYNGTDITSGTAVNEGTRLSFEAKNLPSGKMVDKWVLNGKKEVKQGYGYSIKTEDAVEEGGKKVITVTRTLKDAASITINYNPDELTVEKKDTANGKWTEIPSGSAVDEGSGLWFNAKNIPSGKRLEKWLLNGKKEVKSHGVNGWYTVNLEDAVDEGGKKVIRIERILKDAALITINYNSAELKIEKLNTTTKAWEELPANTPVYEGSKLQFNAKNIPSGKTVDKWLLNGETTIATGRDYCFYTVKAEDADSANTITITRKLKDAALIIINYNSDELTVKDTKSSTKINPGTAVYEGTNLWLAAKNIPPGKKLVQWQVNSREFPSNNFDGWYSVNAEDADSANTVTVKRILKDAASITIEYNESLIKIKNWNTEKEAWDEIPSGTAVDEGSLLGFETKDGHSSVTKWILNGKKEVEAHVAYQVDSKDAVDEGGKKVIVVTFE